MLRLHSRLGLVSNSSGEIFVVKKDQIPENLDDMIRSLWVVWLTQHADDWEKREFDLSTDPSSWFALSPIDAKEEGYYGRTPDSLRIAAVEQFFRRHAETDKAGWMPGTVDIESVRRVIDNNPDIKFFCDLYDEYRTQFDLEGRDHPEGYWLYEAHRYVAEQAIEAGLFEEMEEIAYLFANGDGMFGQWRWAARDFKMFHAYEGAEFTGEIDNHVFPQSFVHFVCNTLGWFVYHNG